MNALNSFGWVVLLGLGFGKPCGPVVPSVEIVAEDSFPVPRWVAPSDRVDHNELTAHAPRHAPGFTGNAAVDSPTVRFAYIIPSNRTPQPGAVENLQRAALLMQAWLCEQMDRAGLGPLGMRYEKEEDGYTPKVHVVDVGVTDETIRSYVWGETIEAALDAGLPLWTPGQVWLLVPESHVQLPDGQIVGGTALGLGYGDADAPGVAMVGSEWLWLDLPRALGDDQPYDDMSVPAIGPYPLVGEVSYPWFCGSTRSELTSCWLGAMMHELGHAFGLAHDPRNDTNFHGNLMFNGLRGMRGALLRDRYPQNDCRLSLASALSLGLNLYLEPCDNIPPMPNLVRLQPSAPTGVPVELRRGTDPPPLRCEPPGFASGPISLAADPDAPVVTLTSTDPLTWTDGLVRYTATASDASGLALALFRKGGDTLAELPLEGTDAEIEFRTPYLSPGETATFYLAVFDAQGNRTNVAADRTVAPGASHAPRPYVRIARSWSDPGETVLLDASWSSDPDGNAMTFEWDLDGDGAVDTPPSAVPTRPEAFSKGTRRIGVRITDGTGAASESTLISQRAGPFPVEPCLADLNGDGLLDNGDIWVFITLFLARDLAVDLNSDGFLDNGDIGAFVALYLAGC